VAAYSVDTFNMSTIPPSLGDLVNKTSRYSYGTFPGPMYDGAKAAMQFYQKIGPALIEKRVKHLSQLVMNGLMDRNNLAKGPNGKEIKSPDGQPLLWKMHNSQGPIITILTPQEDISRGAQVGFTIKGLKQPEANPTAGQRFCDYARKNNVILRYVAENDIHCVRVSTHYYNNLGDIKKFFEVLDGFLKEEGWF
jgi:selenocysteine lyase/cysteine desulfurase